MVIETRSAASIIEDRRIVFSDCLFVPKMTRTGPIIAPPPLTYPLFLTFRRKIRVTATIAMIIPAIIRVKPRLTNVPTSMSIV